MVPSSTGLFLTLLLTILSSTSRRTEAFTLFLPRSFGTKTNPTLSINYRLESVSWENEPSVDYSNNDTRGENEAMQRIQQSLFQDMEDEQKDTRAKMDESPEQTLSLLLEDDDGSWLNPEEDFDIETSPGAYLVAQEPKFESPIIVDSTPRKRATDDDETKDSEINVVRKESSNEQEETSTSIGKIANQSNATASPVVPSVSTRKQNITSISTDETSDSLKTPKGPALVAPLQKQRTSSSQEDTESKVTSTSDVSPRDSIQVPSRNNKTAAPPTDGSYQKPKSALFKSPLDMVRTVGSNSNKTKAPSADASYQKPKSALFKSPLDMVRTVGSYRNKTTAPSSDGSYQKPKSALFKSSLDMIRTVGSYRNKTKAPLADASYQKPKRALFKSPLDMVRAFGSNSNKTKAPSADASYQKPKSALLKSPLDMVRAVGSNSNKTTAPSADASYQKPKSALFKSPLDMTRDSSGKNKTTATSSSDQSYQKPKNALFKSPLDITGATDKDELDAPVQNTDTGMYSEHLAFKIYPKDAAFDSPMEKPRAASSNKAARPVEASAIQSQRIASKDETDKEPKGTAFVSPLRVRLSSDDSTRETSTFLSTDIDTSRNPVTTPRKTLLDLPPSEKPSNDAPTSSSARRGGLFGVATKKPPRKYLRGSLVNPVDRLLDSPVSDISMKVQNAPSTTGTIKSTKAKASRSTGPSISSGSAFLNPRNSLLNSPIAKKSDQVPKPLVSKSADAKVGASVSLNRNTDGVRPNIPGVGLFKAPTQIRQVVTHTGTSRSSSLVPPDNFFRDPMKPPFSEQRLGGVTSASATIRPKETSRTTMPTTSWVASDASYRNTKEPPKLTRPSLLESRAELPTTRNLPSASSIVAASQVSPISSFKNPLDTMADSPIAVRMKDPGSMTISSKPASSYQHSKVTRLGTSIKTPFAAFPNTEVSFGGDINARFLKPNQIVSRITYEKPSQTTRDESVGQMTEKSFQQSTNTMPRRSYQNAFDVGFASPISNRSNGEKHPESARYVPKESASSYHDIKVLKEEPTAPSMQLPSATQEMGQRRATQNTKGTKFESPLAQRPISHKGLRRSKSTHIESSISKPQTKFPRTLLETSPWKPLVSPMTSATNFRNEKSSRIASPIETRSVPKDIPKNSKAEFIQPFGTTNFHELSYYDAMPKHMVDLPSKPSFLSDSLDKTIEKSNIIDVIVLYDSEAPKKANLTLASGNPSTNVSTAPTMAIENTITFNNASESVPNPTDSSNSTEKTRLVSSSQNLTSTIKSKPTKSTRPKLSRKKATSTLISSPLSNNPAVDSSKIKSAKPTFLSVSRRASQDLALGTDDFTDGDTFQNAFNLYTFVSSLLYEGFTPGRYFDPANRATEEWMNSARLSYTLKQNQTNANFIGSTTHTFLAADSPETNVNPTLKTPNSRRVKSKPLAKSMSRSSVGGNLNTSTSPTTPRNGGKEEVPSSASKSKLEKSTMLAGATNAATSSKSATSWAKTFSATTTAAFTEKGASTHACVENNDATATESIPSLVLNFSGSIGPVNATSGSIQDVILQPVTADKSSASVFNSTPVAPTFSVCLYLNFFCNLR